jgi:hypothetical protein
MKWWSQVRIFLPFSETDLRGDRQGPWSPPNPGEKKIGCSIFILFLAGPPPLHFFKKVKKIGLTSSTDYSSSLPLFGCSSLCLNSHAASAFSASQNHNPPPSLSHSLPGTNCFRSMFRPFLPHICVSVFPSSTYFFEMILGFRISIFYFCE